MNDHPAKPVSIIVAVARNGAIGLHNELLWHIPEDFRWFKRHTLGNTVVMGRKTWESLPRKPLPGRRNIVISDLPGDIIPGALTAGSIDEALELMDDGSENFIIGGGSIYRQFLPMAGKLYLTVVDRDYEADTWFPELAAGEWKETFREEHPEGDPAFVFSILEREG